MADSAKDCLDNKDWKDNVAVINAVDTQPIKEVANMTKLNLQSTVDGNLVTGQNPQSSKVCVDAFIALLA